MQRPTAFSSAMNNGYQNFCIAPRPCVGPTQQQYQPNGGSYVAPTLQPFQPNKCFMPVSAIRRMSNTMSPSGLGYKY